MRTLLCYGLSADSAAPAVGYINCPLCAVILDDTSLFL
jgi:hypothetical protein